MNLHLAGTVRTVEPRLTARPASAMRAAVVRPPVARLAPTPSSSGEACGGGDDVVVFFRYSSWSSAVASVARLAGSLRIDKCADANG